MRSPELIDWISNLTHKPDELKQKIISMPKRLKEELLEEAYLRNSKIKQMLTKPNISILANDLEIDALLKYCMTQEIFKHNLELTLDGWNDRNVATFKFLETLSLFAVITPNCKKERPFFRKEVLFTSQNISIVYTGELLSQFDWDVFHALICLSRWKFDTVTAVQPSVILELLGLPRNALIYDQLESSLVRLRTASISINHVYPNNNHLTVKTRMARQRQILGRANLSLLNYYSWRHGILIRYSLDPRLTILFGNFEYGLIDWKSRSLLAKNEMAKKLQCLIASQKANQQYYKVGKIRDLCFVTGDMSVFSRLLEKALRILLEIGAIKAFWIEKSEKGLTEEKLLCIWKSTCPSKAGQNQRVSAENIVTVQHLTKLV